MATNQHIRPATYLDWKNLAALYRECFPDEPEGQISAYCREYLDETELLFIGDELAGAIIALPRPDEGLLWLQIIAVAKKLRRSGAGKMLMARFETMAAERGYSRVALATRAWYLPAHRLYDSCGYTRTRDPETGDWIFSKDIEPRPHASTRTPEPPRRRSRSEHLARNAFGRVAYRLLVTLPETGGISFMPSGTVDLSTPPVSASDQLVEVRGAGERIARLAEIPATPIQLGHWLSNHPLFEDERLKRLLQRMPPHFVHVRSVAAEDRSAERLDIAGVDAFAALTEGGLHLTLDNVQFYDADYNELLRAYLAQLAEHCDELMPEVHGARCSIVISAGVSSAGQLASQAHCHRDLRVFNQIRGTRTLATWPADVLDEPTVEALATGAADDTLPVRLQREQRRAAAIALAPGQGVLLPSFTPYRISDSDSIDIAFIAAFQTRANQRRTKLHAVNRELRALGLPVSGPGKSWLADSVKERLHTGLQVRNRLASRLDRRS